MFDTPEGTVDHELRRRAEGRAGRLAVFAQENARRDREVSEIVRAAADDGDWRTAGCSSEAQWLVQVYRCDYATALQITRTSEALRILPALDDALGKGGMTLDEVAAATPFATPATEAEIVRRAVGKAPSQIALVARTLSPPTVTDDAALRRRRALSLRWIEGDRELLITGRLPLEQGLLFEQAIRTATEAQRARDKHDGIQLEWQQSTADALVTLTTTSNSGDGGGMRRSNATVILHLSADEPPYLEGAGTISPESADYIACDARHLTIKRQGRDLVHSPIKRCATYAQKRALYKRSKHCQYPGCTSTHHLDAHHLLEYWRGGQALLDDLILLCSRHHRLLHDHHIQTSGTAENPVFKDQAGHTITANQPHAPPR